MVIVTLRYPVFPADNAICASRFSPRVRTYSLTEQSREDLQIINAAIRRNVKLHPYRPFNAQRLSARRIGRLNAADRPRAARSSNGGFSRCCRGAWRCTRLSAVLLFSNGEAGRGSAAGFTSRFGCSTFFSGLGLGLGLGFGLGSGLWITTAPLSAVQALPLAPAQVRVQQRAPRQAAPPEAAQDRLTPPL